MAWFLGFGGVEPAIVARPPVSRLMGLPHVYVARVPRRVSRQRIAEGAEFDASEDSWAPSPFDGHGAVRAGALMPQL